MTTVSTRAARTATAITPNDSTVFTPMYEALWVGVEGNIKITDGEGNTVTLTVPQGLVPVNVSKVFSTDTTASAIVGLRY